MQSYRSCRFFGRFVIASAGVVLTLAACTSGGQSSTVRAPSAQLTPAQARAAFDRFIPAFLSAQRSHNPQAELDLVTGAELPAVERLPSQALGPTVSGLTGERFYVPRLAGYPRWFVVTANAPANQEKFFFVLVQAAAGARWRDATELYQLPGYPPALPDLSGVRLTHGYATAVPASDPSLATAPSELPAGFSAYYDAAMSNPSAPAPTGYSNTLVPIVRAAIREAPRYGWREIDQLRPASFPVYALRLANGGAAVVYATRETFGWQAISAHASLHAPRSAVSMLAAPDPYTLSFLRITAVRVGLRIRFSTIDEHLAIDPAVHGGTVADFLNGKTYLISKS
jgi:hypothetical protein